MRDNKIELMSDIQYVQLVLQESESTGSSTQNRILKKTELYKLST